MQSDGIPTDTESAFLVVNITIIMETLKGQIY